MLSFVMISYMVVPLVVGLLIFAAFLVYIWIRYGPIIERIFEEPPIFAPMRVAPEEGGEGIRFGTPDGRELAGTYFEARTRSRAGVIVFCPEFLGDRWSFRHYCDGLRESGFDLFTFDFRNHGDSQTDPDYKPLQWVSDLELVDLKAALDYLRRRPDRDPAGVGLFGVSRGGGTALCIAAEDPTIWAVATDGAFPTRSTVLAYIYRWAWIYVRVHVLYKLFPRYVFRFAGWAGRINTQRRLGRDYPDMERAVARLAPRPWFLIHGEKDAYIAPEIALELFARAGQPKQSWIVPGAKHNRCREADPDQYRDRLVSFFRRFAPRRVDPIAPPAGTDVAEDAMAALPAHPASGAAASLSTLGEQVMLR